MRKAAVLTVAAVAPLIVAVPTAYADDDDHGDNNIGNVVGNSINHGNWQSCGNSVGSQNVIAKNGGSAKGKYENGSVRCEQDNSAHGKISNKHGKHRHH